MSHVKTWIHTVWGTKNHEPMLTKDLRYKLFNHVKENSKEKNIYIDFINGYLDHVHCLLSLSADMSISKTLQLIKGESAHWVNDAKLIKGKFEWAGEYFAVSVSESLLDKVRNYIKNQEEHHRKVSFKEECEEFMKRYNFKRHG
jgi:putative transposase